MSKPSNSYDGKWGREIRAQAEAEKAARERKTVNHETEVKREDGVPERVFLRACHPASPNHNCTWTVSKDQEDSVEYVRADLLATVRREEREAAARIAESHSATDCDGPDCGIVIAKDIRASATGKGEMNG